VDKDKQFARPGSSSSPHSADRAQPSRGRSEPAAAANSANPSTKRDDDELYNLLPELRPPKLSPEAIAAAMQAMQIDPEAMDSDGGKSAGSDGGAGQQACASCGRPNRRGNKFCASCGAPLDGKASEARSVASASADWQSAKPLSPDVLASSSVVEPSEAPNGTHHYHHHYHHHFFQGGAENSSVRPVSAVSRDPEKLRNSPVLKGESMSRGEAAVRRVTQEWVLACNTKHLDDLLDLYSGDALVLRSNFPSVRGAAAIREFFFNALDSGLGEVEIEPLRVEVVGGIAYEAGRCKALVSGGLAGKRREERGKYLWVLTKQDDGEWKIAADCWSSDLTLATAESEISLVGGAKPGAPRKNL
jgi:ketosteroid isomerase-like protein